MTNEKVRYWTELSEYDLDTAKAMLDTKRFLYVAFMCHQCVEKIMKAYYQRVKDEMPPKTHNLRWLLQETGLDKLMSDEHKSLIMIIEPMNIEARYPHDKERILKSLTHEKCSEMLQKVRGLHTWIKSKL